MHYLSVLRDLVHKVLRSGETSSVRVCPGTSSRIAKLSEHESD